MKDFIQCLEIAKEAHKGQTRWNGESYIIHPLFVATQFTDERLKCIAILHDVIEDTNCDKEMLYAKGVRGDIVAIVDVLSRRTGESYKDFILRICEVKSAIMVKIEDLKHNLSDLKAGSMRDKYELALFILETHLPNSASQSFEESLISAIHCRNDNLPMVAMEQENTNEIGGQITPPKVGDDALPQTPKINHSKEWVFRR